MNFETATAMIDMRTTGCVWLTAALLLAGCGPDYQSRYEEGVADYEPIYCYQTIGDVACYRTPQFRDERQLVNYYGPAPYRYERPEDPPEARLDPPPALNYYVRDSEPIPRPAPRGSFDDRPWLAPGYESPPATSSGGGDGVAKAAAATAVIASPSRRTEDAVLSPHAPIDLTVKPGTADTSLDYMIHTPVGTTTPPTQSSLPDPKRPDSPPHP